ncbi:MAG TPA: phosphoribosylglycinamide formyltransferase [Polyangiaceae bacterium]|nr:phosphoribosylglycinamide formyltransferase [Polyangiaceae bacterium]
MALNLGVLVSGNGTNLQAILDAVASGELDARVRCVVSNKREAFALERARKAGVPAIALAHKEYATREAFDEAVLAALREHGVEWVVLAGFMRVLTPGFLRSFAGRVVNVHPALLPAFPGVNAVAQALAHGVRVSGCTVHFVDEGVDSGPIIAQRAVPVLDGDDEASLAARIHAAEHELFVAVLADIAAGRVAPAASPAGGGSA